MYINVPQKFSKKDIKYIGKIYKGKGYSYILSDVNNILPRKTVKLNGYGFYSHVYNICNTYTFIIGNQVKSKDINHKKVDFFRKIVEFECENEKKSKKIRKIDIPSKILTITSNERWLENDLRLVENDYIDFIINNSKTHLKAFKRPLERQLRYLCDNENGIGICEHGFSQLLLYDNKVQILKDTSFDGYIIKTDTENKLK